MACPGWSALVVDSVMVFFFFKGFKRRPTFAERTNQIQKQKAWPKVYRHSEARVNRPKGFDHPNLTNIDPSRHPSSVRRLSRSYFIPSRLGSGALARDS